MDMDKILVEDKRQRDTNNKRKETIMKTTSKLTIVLAIVCFLLATIAIFFAIKLANNSVKTAEETTTPEAMVIAENMSTTFSTFSQGKIEISTDNVIHLSVVNPEDGDQEQVPHPHIYAQTNKSATPVKFIIDIPKGYVGITGSFDADGVKDGVYKAYPSGHFETILTDGFALIIREKWAQDEFKFRLDEAKKYNWAYGTIDYGPLAPKTPAETQAPAAPAKTRIPTGTNGQWKQFSMGDSVVGSVIEINGVIHNTNPKGYVVYNAKYSGRVQYGVINPWADEIKDQEVIQN